MNQFEYPRLGETLYKTVLDNGLTIEVVPRPGFTKKLVYFATDFGAIHTDFELDGVEYHVPAGVAHFLEHKMFDMPDGSNALSTLSENGANPNAYTTGCMTAYYFESTSDFYKNLKCLLNFVSTPYFTPESVEKEQGIIAQEIRMYEDDPYSVVYLDLMQSLFQHHPIRDDVAGTVESISEITAETLYDCHKVFYNPGNMSLCVVGDVDPEMVKKTALEVLTAQRGETPALDYCPGETLLPLRPRRYRSMEVAAPLFHIGAKLPCEAGGQALLRQKLISGAALSYLYGRSSPFYNRLYGEGLVNTEFFADVQFTNGTACVLLGGESRDPERVLSEIIAEAEKCAKNGLDKALWSRCKKAAYGARIRALSSFGGLCAAMAEADFADYNCLDSFAVMDSVTDEDIRTFIAENLTSQRFAMCVVNPQEVQE